MIYFPTIKFQSDEQIVSVICFTTNYIQDYEDISTCGCIKRTFLLWIAGIRLNRVSVEDARDGLCFYTNFHSSLRRTTRQNDFHSCLYHVKKRSKSEEQQRQSYQPTLQRKQKLCGQICVRQHQRAVSMLNHLRRIRKKSEGTEKGGKTKRTVYALHQNRKWGRRGVGALDEIRKTIFSRTLSCQKRQI